MVRDIKIKKGRWVKNYSVHSEEMEMMMMIIGGGGCMVHEEDKDRRKKGE